jgi:hypothetical protein
MEKILLFFVVNVVWGKFRAALFDAASFASIRRQIHQRETTVNRASTYERGLFSYISAVFDLSFRPALLVLVPTRHDFGIHHT